MGASIQVLIIIGTIICFSLILCAAEWKNETATSTNVLMLVSRILCLYLDAYEA
jgi:hypothetical protein